MQPVWTWIVIAFVLAFPFERKLAKRIGKLEWELLMLKQQLVEQKADARKKKSKRSRK